MEVGVSQRMSVMFGEVVPNENTVTSMDGSMPEGAKQPPRKLVKRGMLRSTLTTRPLASAD